MKRVINSFLKVYKDKKIDKKIRIISIFFSIFFAMGLVFGFELDNLNTIRWTLLTLIFIIVISLFLIPFFYYAFEYLLSFKEGKDKKINKKVYLYSFLIIFGFGFLVYLAMYPGMYGYDALFQIDALLKYSVDTHHSVFHTWILSLFVNTFESHVTAIAIYSFIQLVIMSLISAYICYYFYSKTHNKKLYIISMLFFTVILPYKLMVVSVSQDVLFAGIYALLFINLIEFVTEKKHNYVTTIIYVFLILLLRNNGFYVLIFPAIVLLFTYIKEWKYFILCFFIPLVLYKGCYIVVCHYIGIDVSNHKYYSIQEKSSLFVQQIGRAYYYNKDDFDMDSLKKYFHKIEIVDLAARKEQCISDGMKRELLTKEVAKDEWAFIKFYLVTGFKHPVRYIEAFFFQNIGLYYPLKTYPDSRMYHPLIEYRSLDKKYSEPNKHYTVENKPILKYYDKYINYYINSYLWQKIPGLNLIIGMSFYFYFSIVTLIIILYRKQYKLLFPFSLIIGLIINLILSPVIIYRYVFPIIISCPLFIYLIICSNKKLLK